MVLGVQVVKLGQKGFDGLAVADPRLEHVGPVLAVSRPLLGRVLNVLKGPVGPYLTTHTVTNLDRHVVGMKHQILEPDHEAWVFGRQGTEGCVVVVIVVVVIAVPVVPQMGEGRVLVGAVHGVLDGEGDGVLWFRREMGTLEPLVVVPFGRIGVFAHGPHPVVGMPHGNDGHDRFGRDGVNGWFSLVDFTVLGSRVFAPRDLPTHPVGLQRTHVVLVKINLPPIIGDTFGDFAIFLDEFGHEVGAGVEHSQTAQTAIDGGNHASKIEHTSPTPQ